MFKLYYIRVNDPGKEKIFRIAGYIHEKYGPSYFFGIDHAAEYMGYEFSRAEFIHNITGEVTQVRREDLFNLEAALNHPTVNQQVQFTFMD